jgi:hypothetical protein
MINPLISDMKNEEGKKASAKNSIDYLRKLFRANSL